MLKEPIRRVRFLTHEEAHRLLAQLPEQLVDMAAFSLATQLRAANVTGPQWTQVDLSRKLAWVHPDQAKARKAIAVPLNADAIALVQKQIGKHQTRVFSFHGKSITQVSTKACYTRSSERESLTSAGTICDIRGRAGTCRTARFFSRCRSSADGRARRWCGDTRISPRIISRRLPKFCVA